MRYVFIIIILFTASTLSAQVKNFQIPDSLKNKSFEKLNTLFYNSEPKSIQDSIYSNTYLKKAVQINDSIKIATGFLLLTSIAKNEEEIEKLVDNSIEYSKNKNDFFVPCTAYSIKANICKNKKNFKEALDFYLLTHESADKSGNTELKRITKYNIGVLKTKIGNHDEALDYFRSYWNLYSDSRKYDRHHLKTFFALSNAYAKNGMLDSAAYFSNLGIRRSIFFNDENQYYLFVFLEGLNKYYNKNYLATIDSINKAIPYLIKYNDINNLAVGYSYLGKSNFKLNNEKESIIYFKKVDSIFNKTNDLLPRCRSIYKNLIEFYKKNNDFENQLYYTNQLLKLDSILNDNYKYLNSTIYKKYETRELQTEKMKLSQRFSQEKSVLNRYLIASFLLALIVLFGLVFNYFKRKKYQQKYKELMIQLKNRNNKKERREVKTKAYDIDQSVIERVLINLEKFEKDRGYLKKKITLSSLAKIIGTNSKYLSKILNSYKEKKFTDYINDLRIEYIVEELKLNKKMRKYTIDVIAQEAGFNSRRSFSNVFLNKTGISVSFLINKLNEEL